MDGLPTGAWHRDAVTQGGGVTVPSHGGVEIPRWLDSQTATPRIRNTLFRRRLYNCTSVEPKVNQQRQGSQDDLREG